VAAPHDTTALHPAGPPSPSRALLLAQLQWHEARDKVADCQRRLTLLRTLSTSRQGDNATTTTTSSSTTTTTSSKGDLADVSSSAADAVGNMTGATVGGGGAGAASGPVLALQAELQAAALQLEEALLAVGAAADPAGLGLLVTRLQVSWLHLLAADPHYSGSC
jgi:hypothetical protein